MIILIPQDRNDPAGSESFCLAITYQKENRDENE